MVQQNRYGIGSRIRLCTASILCGSETGTIKAKDELRRSASKAKFMNWDEKKKIFPGKKKNYLKEAKIFRLEWRWRETLLTKFMDHGMRRLNSRMWMEW